MATSKSPTLAFVGRLLLAFLFISSGIQKLQTFDVQTGGPVMQGLAPKLDHALQVFESHTGVKIPLEKDMYVYALGTAIFLELAGGLLFVLNFQLGALMLILFTVGVTPIMHNFWDEKEGSKEQMVDMIQFFKNLSLVGAFLVYLGQQPRKVHQD